MDEVPELTDRLVAALADLDGSNAGAAAELRESCHDLVVGFLDAERQRVRDDERRRVTLWEGLLTGRVDDPACADHAADHAAGPLGLPARGPYVVVVARAGLDEEGVMRGGAMRLAGLGVASAWYSRADEVVALLALDGTDVEEVRDVLGEALLAPVGVSPEIGSIVEAGSGYREARLALRTLGTAPGAGAPGVVSLDDCLPEAMLIDAPALAVGCHRNTVVHRLRKIERLIGRPIATPPIPVEVSLALLAVHLDLPSAMDA